jgi:hypothetical protein
LATSAVIILFSDARILIYSDLLTDTSYYYYSSPLVPVRLRLRTSHIPEILTLEPGDRTINSFEHLRATMDMNENHEQEPIKKDVCNTDAAGRMPQSEEKC